MSLRIRCRVAYLHYADAAMPAWWEGFSPLRTACHVVRDLARLPLMPLLVTRCPRCACAPDRAPIAVNYRSILEHGACLACAALEQGRPAPEIYDAFESFGRFADHPDPATCCDGRPPT